MPITAAGILGNTPPTVGEVLILPLRETFTNEDLTCEAQGIVEPDRHQVVTTNYAWTINGEPVAVEDGERLPAAQFERGDQVVCIVTLSDPFGPGIPTSSLPKVIINSPPTLGSASITPRHVRPNDELNCRYDGFQDADADEDQSRIQWYVNGEPIDGEGAVLQGVFDAGDEVTCEVTAYDGFDAGEVRSAVVTVDPFTVADASIECLSPTGCHAHCSRWR